MSQANLCFIGAGFHATRNIYPSAIEAGANMKAIATRSLERSSFALKRFGSGGTPYDNYKDMLANEKCDGVVVVAQPGDHSSFVMDCIQAGKNVFVEKPLGMTEQEAHELAVAAEKAGIVLMVGFMKRFAPVYAKLKEIITKKELGEVHSFEARFAVNSTPFCKNDEEFIKFAAIHIVDLVRYLFGEVVHLAGFKNSQQSNISQTISLKFANGVVGSLYFSGMTAWSRESEHFLVTFKNGYAFADELYKLTIHHTQTFPEEPWKSLYEKDSVFTPSQSPMSGTLRDLYLRGFVGELKHFIQCCLTGKQPVSNGRENVQTMVLCDQILSVLKET